MQKQEWQHNVQTPIFFFPFFFVFCCFRHNTQVQWLDVSAYWCNLIYMSAMHFFLYCIHLRNTPLHILVLVPSSQFVSNSAFYFFCSY